MPTTNLLSLLLLLILLSLSASDAVHHHQIPARPSPVSSTLNLEVIKPKQNGLSSWDEMQSQDRARLAYLSSLAAVGKSWVPIAWGRQLFQSPRYMVRVNVGTPPQTMVMAVDTSSDAAWMPCSGCVGCGIGTNAFNTAKSSSYKPLPCGSPQCKQVPNPTCGGTSCTFNMSYGSSTILSTLVQDTLSLSRNPVPGYTFGCISRATGHSAPPQGLLGLGRGPLSLLSQTQSLYKSTFSYCLPSFNSLNFTGTLRLGPVAQPLRIKVTPLLRNPRRSSLYYVNMIGIKVGRNVVNIPPNALAFNPATGAGTVFDSGTVFTRLVEPAYNAVRDEFRRRMGHVNATSLGGFDTCYSVPIRVPTITFMFTGMNMTLAQDNFLLRSASTSVSCLAIASSGADAGVNSVLNVIASMQQQNHRVLFDGPKSRLGVAREPCS
ncbi:hypothetical protein V2J09_012159 [Rumex salicifolius]